MTKGWAYPGVSKCLSCETEFYVTSPHGDEPNFCPFCACRDLKPADEEEEE